jgi:hypothetical protein
VGLCHTLEIPGSAHGHAPGTGVYTFSTNADERGRGFRVCVKTSDSGIVRLRRPLCRKPAAFPRLSMFGDTSGFAACCAETAPPFRTA